MAKAKKNNKFITRGFVGGLLAGVILVIIVFFMVIGSDSFYTSKKTPVNSTESCLNTCHDIFHTCLSNHTSAHCSIDRLRCTDRCRHYSFY